MLRFTQHDLGPGCNTTILFFSESHASGAHFEPEKKLFEEVSLRIQPFIQIFFWVLPAI